MRLMYFSHSIIEYIRHKRIRSQSWNIRKSYTYTDTQNKLKHLNNTMYVNAHQQQIQHVHHFHNHHKILILNRYFNKYIILVSNKHTHTHTTAFTTVQNQKQKCIGKFTTHRKWIFGETKHGTCGARVPKRSAKQKKNGCGTWYCSQPALGAARDPDGWRGF